MKYKIVGIFICMLMISSSIAMVSGKTDEKDNLKVFDTKYLHASVHQANPLGHIHLSVSGSISGYVHQTSGDPIYSATVEVIRQDQGGYWSTTTEIDGSYLLTGIPSGYYKVRAMKEGYAREYYNNVFYSDEAEVIYLSGSEAITGIDFSLNLGGGISGIIFNNKDGSPIENAQVFIRPSKYAIDDGFLAISDSNGYYVVEGLALGFYKATVDADGYASLRYYDGVYGWDNADNIEVNPPDVTEGIDISLELAGSIAGFVYQGDGVTPISNADICADPVDGGYEGIGAWSSTDGSYTIDCLPPNGYTLRINHDSWFASEFYDSKPSYQTADIVNVIAGEETSDIIFTLDEGGWITGFVFDEETGDPISDLQLGASLSGGGGAPSAPGTVFDGSFKFVLHEGEYFIEAGIGVGAAHGQKYLPEWYNNTYNVEDATPVRVTIGEETSHINFYLSKSGSISGSVYDINENPLSDASISAFSDDFSGSVSISGDDGSFSVVGLPSDDYYVQVSVLGYISEFYDDATSKDDATLVSVHAPGDTSNINFYLTPADTQPPDTPTINGPNSGTTGEEYNFTARTSDPDGDQVYYLFDWGDDTDSGWFGPFHSEVMVSSSHSWSEKGNYEIKVKAKDIYGVQSSWSDPLPVTMPYTMKNPLQQFLAWLFQRFPHAFPLLQYRMGH